MLYIDDEEKDDQVFEECYKAAVDFIRDQYEQLNRNPYKRIFVHITTSTNRENIQSVFWDVQNIVINTAKKLDKAVTFNVSGDDSYLPEKSISMLKESFIHLLTNCVDHGIETKGDINVSIKETFEEIKINIRFFYTIFIA